MKGTVVGKLSGIGKTATVRKTQITRKRKDGKKGKSSTRYCVIVVGPGVKIPAFLKKRGVTEGMQMRGCFNDKKDALAAMKGVLK